MKHRMYTQIQLSIPGVGESTHAAELEELDADSCTLLRIVELDPQGKVQGAATATRIAGMRQRPNDVVPHPRTYGDFEGITALELTPEHFERLWAQALELFPALN